MGSLDPYQPQFLPRAHFHTLLETLQQRGYQCIGPQQRDGAIVYGPIFRVEDLPAGIEVEQEAGSYTIRQTGTPRWFAWSNGPQALKPLLFAPRETLWAAECDAQGKVVFRQIIPPQRPQAVLGVRACDLAALQLQDQHFLEADCMDQHYAARRSALLLVAVNCTHPADTCFCASTGDGPGAVDGFDLLLDELDTGFILRAGTERGASILEGLQATPADSAQMRAADDALARATASQKRKILSHNLQHSLFANLDHPRWQQVADRCLACGNCTAVCPTCFCYRESDEARLDGVQSAHLREWDSCFSPGHSYIHGKTIRLETRLRYRQWLTHKLGSWHEQYGRSGCVGCGRCISWCPVGIDITEEVAAICS